MKKPSNEIIEKIQKLLALANSSNEFEAKLAAERATALLTKHNLSMQDVAMDEREYEAIHFMSNKARLGAEQKYLFNILMEFFFVQVVTGKRRHPQTGKIVRVWSFFGQKHNVEIARYVYAFLDTTFSNLYEEFSKTQGKEIHGKIRRNSYYMGLMRGIQNQLRETQKKVQQEAGLVLVRDAGIDDFISDTLGKTRKLPQRSVSVNSDAYRSGVEDGEKIRIARGLEGEKKQNLGETLKIGGAQ